MRLTTSALFFSLVLPTAAFAAPNQTITGTVTDSLCGAHHMMQGASAEKCTRECVKQGADFALMKGDKMYVLKGDKAKIDKFSGQNVMIKGNISGDVITVEAISAK